MLSDGEGDPPQPPPPPTMEGVGKEEIRVTWEPITCFPEIQGYAMTVAEPSGKSFTVHLERFSSRKLMDKHPEYKVDLLAASSHQNSFYERRIILLGMQEGVPYTARVAAWNTHGWSAFSEPSAPAVIRRPQPPAPPMLQAVGPDSMRVSWLLADLDCRPAATGVIIAVKAEDDPDFRYVDKKGALRTDKVPVLPAASKAVVVKNLKRGVLHRAQIAVENDLGCSEYSAFCPAEKIALPLRLDPPVLDVAHGDRIRVSWDPPKMGLPTAAYAVALEDPGKQTLYLDHTGAPHDNREHAGPIPGTQTSILVPKILMNTAYKARVASKNILGWGPYSEFSNSETVTCLKKKESPVVNEDDILVTM